MKYLSRLLTNSSVACPSVHVYKNSAGGSKSHKSRISDLQVCFSCFIGQDTEVQGIAFVAKFMINLSDSDTKLKFSTM